LIIVNTLHIIKIYKWIQSLLISHFKTRNPLFVIQSISPWN